MPKLNSKCSKVRIARPGGPIGLPGGSRQPPKLRGIQPCPTWAPASWVQLASRPCPTCPQVAFLARPRPTRCQRLMAWSILTLKVLRSLLQREMQLLVAPAVLTSVVGYCRNWLQRVPSAVLVLLLLQPEQQRLLLSSRVHEAAVPEEYQGLLQSPKRRPIMHACSLRRPMVALLQNTCSLGNLDICTTSGERSAGRSLVRRTMPPQGMKAMVAAIGLCGIAALLLRRRWR
mmetsp:Transcript_73011/g.144727  ORF Transcript_73011/g.144727 Transcript_73011/m.144727 type:complete len:231 (-) Transcript_73011:712-1404(-)